MTTLRRRAPWLPAALLLVAALAATQGATAASAAWPSKAKVGGLKPADWIAQWWQWAYGTPEAFLPLYDETGDYASIGQRGPVWFLCGAYNESGVVTRDIVVPEGRSLFFPVFAIQFDNVGVENPRASEFLFADAEEFALAVNLNNIYCEVNGIALADTFKRRIRSGVFSYTVGPGTLPINFGAAVGDVAFPVVSDGFWVMLRPLPVGEHTVEFGGSVGSTYNYTQQVTYNITVVDATE